MATKKTPLTEDDALMPVGNEVELDQAIDDLRGVLKADADTPAADFDIGGSDFASTEAPAFGGGFDMNDAGFGGEDFSASAEAMPQPGSALNANLDLIMDIPIDVEIVLGSSRMQVSGLMNLEEGATIALDKRIGEPVEITVNGRRIGKGEITVLEHDDTRFGVKLTEVLSTRRT